MLRRKHREAFNTPSTNEKRKNMKMKFIDSIKFIVTLLLSLTDNPAEGLVKGECKDYKSYLEYVTVNHGLWIFKWSECNKSYEKEFYENLVERPENTYRFCDRDINKLCLMLKKGRYLYEYMD